MPRRSGRESKVTSALISPLAALTCRPRKPMKSAAGWHIIKVHETRPKTVPPLAEVRKKVEERALDAKKRGARALWVGRLRAASKIEIDKEAIAAFVKANESTGKPPPQHVVQ